MILFLDVSTTILDNADLIKSILVNVIYFIVFLILLNLIAKKIRIQMETIERNTEYMKQDFRTIKKEFELTREHINTIKNNVDVAAIVNTMIYDTPTQIKNEFIVIKKNVLQLSSLGSIINFDLKLRDAIEKNWDKISPYIHDSKENYSNHHYDLQVYCLYIGSCLELVFSSEEIDNMKHYALEKGHLISSYFAIIGILIKEKYFQENL